MQPIIDAVEDEAYSIYKEPTTKKTPKTEEEHKDPKQGVTKQPVKMPMM